MSDVTYLLDRIEAGDPQAAAELFPLVYDELRRVAQWKLADEKPGNTLQPTALVHEVYVRLVGAKQALTFKSKSSFLSAASEAMRHILVDAARRKLARKRGGDIERMPLDLDRILVQHPKEIVDVHTALDALADHNPQCAELVRLHYFGGFSIAEVADIMNVSRATANRWWIYARAWLKTAIESQL
ncbi:MAG: ECF-type sigma factor [Pirellula sp.]|nr:ECF-type sigma factor [Pirellula sp.]